MMRAGEKEARLQKIGKMIDIKMHTEESRSVKDEVSAAGVKRRFERMLVL